MDILLLYVAGFALEGLICGHSVNQHGAGYNTGSGAVSENVEESCFTGAGNTLEFILC